jgi:hypothetical protein
MDSMHAVLLVSDWAPAAFFGLAGSLIGGSIAAFVSLRVARETRDAAEGAWVRDSRRETYDRFLTTGQQYLIACQSRTDDAIKAAGVEFYAAYGVVQTVADMSVVEAARIYTRRLEELERIALRQNTKWGPVANVLVASCRDARHDVIDAMRSDLAHGQRGTAEGLQPVARHGIQREIRHGARCSGRRRRGRAGARVAVRV